MDIDYRLNRISDQKRKYENKDAEENKRAKEGSFNLYNNPLKCLSITHCEMQSLHPCEFAVPTTIMDLLKQQSADYQSVTFLSSQFIFLNIPPLYIIFILYKLNNLLL